jgi:uncharacterized protein (TIGR03435 family)
MFRPIATAAFLVISASGILAQSEFEVSTIKPSHPYVRGMSFRHVGARIFASNNHTLKENIAYAYTVTPELISGGPAWIGSTRYDIVGVSPGDTRLPDEQIQLMFQTLLAQRFKLEFHREQKEVAVYNLVLGANALKLKESKAASTKGHTLFIDSVPPEAYNLPARNASMAEFAVLMQRVVLDRPVVDHTGLSGKFDFDLQWARLGTEFGRNRPSAPAGTDPGDAPDFFTAIQQLGLKLVPARSIVETLVIDQADVPDEN